MSLIRQIWLLVLCTLVVTFCAGALVNMASVRETLQTQLELKNNDNATAIAQILSQQKGQRELMDLTLSAQFDTGFFRRIAFRSADGKTVLTHESAGAQQRAPKWFSALMPIHAAPGEAKVSDGWRALGSVEVISQDVFAYDELWRASQRSALVLALVGLVSGLLISAAVRRIRKPMDDTVRQAESLERGEYLIVPEPRVPEMKRLTRAMNSMVQRLRIVFEGQAAQVESLRRQASIDLLSGLANRTQFLARLDAALHPEEGLPARGLVLLRIRGLAELNRKLGHAQTDRAIALVGKALDALQGAMPGAFAGRLNGADFALAIDAPDAARSTAEALIVRLRAELGAIGASPEDAPSVIAGTIETRRAMALGELLSQADLSLARAEAAGPYALASIDAQGAPRALSWALLGEHAWNERLRASLSEGRQRLTTFDVVDRAGAVVHLECPLRLQLEPDGPFEVAGDWLPIAMRAGLTSAIDELAVALALDSIETDGLTRGINLSPDSLRDGAFIGRVHASLAARPHAAAKLWLEIGEIAAIEHFELVRELARQVRSRGARFGLEHAGERLGRIERLFEAGLDFVKLDASVTRDVSRDPGRAAFVEGVAVMLHGLSIQVIAEGVATRDDEAALWACGVDAMTGPSIRARAN